MRKKKNVCLIISIIIAVVWLVIGFFTMADVSAGVNSDNLGESIGTAIGMALVMPYLIVATIGTILHVIGSCVHIRGLVLAGLIVECVSIFLMVTWGFGYIAAIIFGFIGYAKMIKKSKNINKETSNDQ